MTLTSDTQHYHSCFRPIKQSNNQTNKYSQNQTITQTNNQLIKRTNKHTNKQSNDQNQTMNQSNTKTIKQSNNNKSNKQLDRLKKCAAGEKNIFWYTFICKKSQNYLSKVSKNACI